MAGVVKVTLNNTTLIDHSDSTLAPDKVLQGYVGYEGDGDRIVGTATGGGSSDGWTRPSDWPDLSLMDITGEVLYMTYMANEENGFCSFTCRTVSGQYTVEIGNIVNGAFVADDTYSINSGTKCEYYFGSANGGYKVVRVTGTITYFITSNSAAANLIDNDLRVPQIQGLLELYGRLPNLNKTNYSGATFTLTNSRKLESVVVKDIAPGSMTSSFSYCVNLQNIETSTWDLSRCTSLNTMFSYCYSLKSLDCENWDTGNVTSMTGTFNCCYLLKSLDVSNWDTGNVTAMSNLFGSCGALKTLDVSNWDTGNVTTMSGIFNGCRSLKTLDVSNWDTGNVTTFVNFVNNCYALKELKENGLVTDACTDLSGFASNCYSLEDIDTTDWDTSSVTNLYNFCSYCYMLARFPLEGMDLSSVLSTGANSNNIASYNQSCLSFTIPATLGSLGSNAFSYCTASDFHFLATTPPTLNAVATSIFNSITWTKGNRVYVPYSADHSVLEAYQTATNWSAIASYIEEEPQ